MRRNLTRRLSVGTAALLVAAAVGGAALAAHGRIGAVQGFRSGGFLGRPGGFLGGGNGFGLGAGPLGGGKPGGFAFGRGPFGLGGAAFGADVLTPAAACLGLDVQSLAGALNGGKTLAEEATGKGPSSCNTADELVTAIVKAQTAVFDDEKAAGWITADQETALVAAFTAQVKRLVDAGPPVPPSAPTPAAGGLLQPAATYLGLSVSDLQSDLKSGKTLASLVNPPATTVDGLVTALEGPAKAKLDAAVTAKTITSDQETAILGKMTTALTNLVNGTGRAGRFGSIEKSLNRDASLKTFARRH